MGVRTLITAHKLSIDEK